MKHTELFDTFLTNINPSEKAVSYARKAHERVREYLSEDEKFKEYVVGSFLYGSYKRQTAVGDIKDVDIVVLTNFDIQSAECTPASVLRKLKAALARCYDDADNPEYQRRSIRVDEPLPDNPKANLTLDVIPAVALDGEDNALWVPDRDQGGWIKSHPKGHLRYTEQLNQEEYSSGRFVPLVKMMKWWWKYQCTELQPKIVRPKPKGFWVECLTAAHFEREHPSYAELFIATLENIFTSYRDCATVPELTDPGIPSQTIKTSMEMDEFKVFLKAAEDSYEVACMALEEDDPDESARLWGVVFGDKFPSNAQKSAASIQQTVTPTHEDLSHVEPLRWPDNRRSGYRVQIDCEIYSQNYHKLGGLNSHGRTLGVGLHLKFKTWTKVPKPYEVYWQVVNRGEHARTTGNLRGKFFQGEETRWETTLYDGTHWIEAFVIKDERCIASTGKFHVTISNPAFRSNA